MSVSIVVENCASCPFAQGPPDDEPGAPWLCDALGAEDGETEPRELPEQQVVSWWLAAGVYVALACAAGWWAYRTLPARWMLP